MSKEHYEDMARRFGIILRLIDVTRDSVWLAVDQYIEHAAAKNERFDRDLFAQAVSDWRAGVKS